jgi:hypothetical protein
MCDDDSTCRTVEVDTKGSTFKKGWFWPSRHRGLILAAVFLGVMAPAVTALSAAEPHTYTARSLLLVPSKAPKETLGAELDYRADQLELVTSHDVLQAALKNPDIARLPLLREQRDPLRWLEKGLFRRICGWMNGR